MSAKVDLLSRADEAARSVDARIREVSCSYAESVRNIEVANSEGQWVSGSDELMRMSVSVLAIEGDIRDSGLEFLGGRYGFEYFDSNSPEEAVRKAARQAVTKLRATPAPAGVYPVLLDAGWGGVLVHVRLLGVSTSGLIPCDHEQLALFEPTPDSTSDT